MTASSPFPSPSSPSSPLRCAADRSRSGAGADRGPDCSVARGLERVRNRIADAGGRPEDVEVVAVTKGFGVDAVQAAARAGLSSIGENYAQEAVGKWSSLDRRLADGLALHFIGQIQTNKVRQLVSCVSVFQSVDRLRLVSEIARRKPGASIMIQLNAAGRVGQGGIDPTAAEELLQAARDHGLDVVGAMAIGPQAADRQVREAFERVAAFARRHALRHRCMGMSGDLEHAVAAGATMVRLGTALFGPRSR